jgi:outer membrane biosynthesis protein TonB
VCAAKKVARRVFLRQDCLMAGAGTKFDSLRLNRSEIERLILVLLLSLAIHLLSWGGYELGKNLGWWQELHWPAWLHHAKKIEPAVQPQVENQEPPLEFVTVEQPATEPPKNAKYYSSQNSRAANPDTDRATDTPKLNGRQTDAPTTADAPRQSISKSPPSPPAQEISKPQEQTPRQLAMNTGNTELQKPEDSQQVKPEPLRPRTLNQARALQANQLQGVPIRQEGGMRRIAPAAFDAIGTQFGAYDEAIIEAIQQYWDNELDSQKFAQDRTGKVTLQFHLNYDGTVSDMRVLENNVGELLCYVCQEAIAGAAPFAKWPSDMRRMVGQNYREVTFTFYYY